MNSYMAMNEASTMAIMMIAMLHVSAAFIMTRPGGDITTVGTTIILTTRFMMDFTAHTTGRDGHSILVSV